MPPFSISCWPRILTVLLWLRSSATLFWASWVVGQGCRVSSFGVQGLGFWGGYGLQVATVDLNQSSTDLGTVGEHSRRPSAQMHSFDIRLKVIPESSAWGAAQPVVQKV